MAAVSTFVARRPSPRQAALFGVRWAIGHGVSLLLLGSLLFALRATVEHRQPALFSSGVLERVVGGVLVALGLWTLFQLLESVRGEKAAQAMPMFAPPGQTATAARKPSRFSRASRLMHTHDEYGRHRGEGVLSLWMGMLHGAAGTGAFVGQTAIALSQSYLVVLAYTLTFGLGVLLAMGFYAGALGSTIAWGGKRAGPILHGVRALTGVAACGIGGCLVMGVALPGLLDRFMH